ncbi:MAG: methylenetetrahydrofolate reductase C-terminal domain-containing protein [Coriobacteriales bacterium]|jgi:5,10-methylenetetrahydrofolate reductase|nr:methylenetetrahydrofolate reductase C-terminal domain-containing protein [Coriobacteriales bacterium]
MANTLKEALERGEFAVSCEVVPGWGAAEKAQMLALEEAKCLFATNRVHAVSVTDNPGGHPALLADAFADDLQAQGITPLVHMSCKDRSRNQIQSQLYALERRGIENVLAMTGDYPTSGWQGRSRPTFDLDAVQMLELVCALNKGLTHKTARAVATERPCHFFAGAVVSPFKWTEAETLTQYSKLEKKLFAGARFIVSQLGYNARKMQELLWFLEDRGHTVPVIANIYLLTLGAARLMRKGGVPGCFASDRLLAKLEGEAQAPDKGQEARITRAAKMVATARGLGYAGVHIGGGGLNAGVLELILNRANELQDAWPQWARELNYGTDAPSKDASNRKVFDKGTSDPDAPNRKVPTKDASGPDASNRKVFDKGASDPDASNRKVPTKDASGPDAHSKNACSTTTSRLDASSKGASRLGTGFYFYQPDETNGLNRRELTPRTEVERERSLYRFYGLSRFAHYWMLTPGKRGFVLLSKLMDWKERKKGRHRRHAIEHLSKVILYGCMDCGDCGLETAAYTCPMTQCPKCQRNGPCGGSSEGWCEVYPRERYCIYFKAYHRLKKYNELINLSAFITGPNNWDLYETSAWSNYTHGRDNTAYRQYLPGADKALTGDGPGHGAVEL